MGSMLIVGGGPAGLTASVEGAKSGFHVTLLEKNSIGDNINCGEGFYDSLKLLGKPSCGVKYRVNSIHFKLINTYRIDKIPLDIWMLDRQKWQSGLAEKANSWGVEIKENYPLQNERIEDLSQDYTGVIDARGSVAVNEYWPEPHYPGRAQTYQMQLEGDFNFLYPCYKIGLEDHFLGYYWIFPKSQELANVGVGWFEPKKSRSHGLSLKSELHKILIKENMQHYRINKSSGGAIPVIPSPCPQKGNILATGDAAGLASPLHGGGIDIACISGYLAARSLVESRPHLYHADLKKTIRPKVLRENKLLQLWKRTDLKNLENIARWFSGKETFGSISWLRFPLFSFRDWKLIRTFLGRHFSIQNFD